MSTMSTILRYIGLVAGGLFLGIGIDSYFKYRYSFGYDTEVMFGNLQIIGGLFLILLFFVPNIKNVIDDYIKNIVKETLKEK